jgi:hypothetical protein
VKIKRPPRGGLFAWGFVVTKLAIVVRYLLKLEQLMLKALIL